VQVTPLAISGAWLFEPAKHEGDRGVFLEWLRRDLLEQHVGHRLDLHQANWSTSMAGALRGVHFAEIPPGQAKYIVCVHGAILDVVLDVRVGSPTYGQWDSILLDDQNKRAVYIAEGLGHGFMALTEGATVVYLCSAPAPGREHGIHPLDPALAIAWPGLAQPASRSRRCSLRRTQCCQRWPRPPSSVYCRVSRRQRGSTPSWAETQPRPSARRREALPSSGGSALGRLARTRHGPGPSRTVLVPAGRTTRCPWPELAPGPVRVLRARHGPTRTMSSDRCWWRGRHLPEHRSR
jgi:dTDP-4-dehydrorhamnose 3,5-epimerase